MSEDKPKVIVIKKPQAPQKEAPVVNQPPKDEKKVVVVKKKIVTVKARIKEEKKEEKKEEVKAPVQSQVQPQAPVQNVKKEVPQPVKVSPTLQQKPKTSQAPAANRNIIREIGRAHV